MIPQRMPLAHLPTPMEPLKYFKDPAYPTLYIKRDDLTGMEFSGNKIRKLEYALQEALDLGCDTLITCGGIQSNHCRATAAAGAKLGLETILLLRSDTPQPPQGNHLLGLLLGAKIVWVSSEEYAKERRQRMGAIAKELEEKGHKGYILPEGASNAIGTFGYFHAFEEILAQEKELGIRFDTIVCPVGSGGTYSGLVFGNAYHRAERKILGVNIAADADHFKEITMQIHTEFQERLGEPLPLKKEDLYILDGYAGRGYALNTPQEMAFFHDFAKKSGLFLDPVYTGKAMRGLLTALQEGDALLKDAENILFIHTGGLFGLFAKAEEFGF